MLVERLELDVMTAGICLAVSHVRRVSARFRRRAGGEARGAEADADLVGGGTEFAVLVALETAKRDSVSGAAEAIEDVQRQGHRSLVVEARSCGGSPSNSSRTCIGGATMISK